MFWHLADCKLGRRLMGLGLLQTEPQNFQQRAWRPWMQLWMPDLWKAPGLIMEADWRGSRSSAIRRGYRRRTGCLRGRSLSCCSLLHGQESGHDLASIPGLLVFTHGTQCMVHRGFARMGCVLSSRVCHVWCPQRRNESLDHRSRSNISICFKSIWI